MGVKSRVRVLRISTRVKIFLRFDAVELIATIRAFVMSHGQVPRAVDRHFCPAATRTFKFDILDDALAIFVPFTGCFRHIQVRQVVQESVFHGANISGRSSKNEPCFRLSGGLAGRFFSFKGCKDLAPTSSAAKAE